MDLTKEGSIPQGTETKEIVEKESLYDIVGATHRGPRDRNEDSRYASGTGFNFAELTDLKSGEKLPDNVEEDTRIATLVETLKGIEVNGRVVTADVVSQTEQAVEDLIKEGRLESLAFVADGAGGHGDGEAASGILSFAFVDTLVKGLRERPDHVVTAEDGINALLEANDVVVAYNNEKPGRDAKTTFIGYVGSHLIGVGDSLAFKRDGSTGDVTRELGTNALADGALEQALELNLSEWLANKLRVPAQPSTAYVGAKIMRSPAILLGDESLKRKHIKVKQVDLQPGDELYLGSDGMLPKQRIVDGKLPQVLAEADQEFRALVTPHVVGMETDKPSVDPAVVENALAIVHGRIFQKTNLEREGAPTDDASLKDKVEFIADEDVAEKSGDSVTALGIKKREPESPTEPLTIVPEASQATVDLPLPEPLQPTVDLRPHERLQQLAGPPRPEAQPEVTADYLFERARIDLDRVVGEGAWDRIKIQVTELATAGRLGAVKLPDRRHGDQTYGPREWPTLIDKIRANPDLLGQLEMHDSVREALSRMLFRKRT